VDHFQWQRCPQAGMIAATQADCFNL
jgi:hypothetical protein